MQPMNSEKFAQNLSRWLDDDLNLADVDQLRTEMAQSTEYQHMYRNFQAVHHQLTDAAQTVVAPQAGFCDRLEARLAQHKSYSPTQTGLAILALILGILFIIALTVPTGVSLLNSDLLLLGSESISQMAQSLAVLAAWGQSALNVGLVLLSAMFLLLQQPVLWGLIVVVLAATVGWGWFIQRTLRRPLSLPTA